MVSMVSTVSVKKRICLLLGPILCGMFDVEYLFACGVLVHFLVTDFSLIRCLFDCIKLRLGVFFLVVK